LTIHFLKVIYTYMVLYKRTRNHKGHLPQKTKKMRGGALLTPEQKKELLRKLSQLLAWGSLGYISWCSVTPVVQIILALLQASGMSTITMFFYEILWVNLVSTLASVSSAASSAGIAAVGSLNVLANAGNTCAAAHAVLRLANPLYKFFLGNVRRIIEVMENPLIINQKLKELPQACNGLLDNFLGDYSRMGQHSIRGLDMTADRMGGVYRKLIKVFDDVEKEVKAAIPKIITPAERSAATENKDWINSYEEFIYKILSTFVEGGERGMSALGKGSEILSQCATGAASAAIYAKGWVSYFFKCMSAPMERHLDDFVVISRKRSRSPSRSPSPSPPPNVDSLIVKMMTEKTPEPTVPESKRLKSGSPKPVEQAEAAMEEIARHITPEPNIITLVHTLNRCARAATAPLPDSSRPIAKRDPRRRLSEIPKTPEPLVPRPRPGPGIKHPSRLSPIEGSPAPNNGGNKRKTRRRNRHRRTRKH
jgi:hypothetical protein